MSSAWPTSARQRWSRTMSSLARRSKIVVIYCRRCSLIAEAELWLGSNDSLGEADVFLIRDDFFQFQMALIIIDFSQWPSIIPWFLLENCHNDFSWKGSVTSAVGKLDKQWNPTAVYHRLLSSAIHCGDILLSPVA